MQKKYQWRVKEYTRTDGVYAKTHGMRNSREWRLWTSVKERCCNPNNKDFHHYGGRGILIADEFKNDFPAFYQYIITIENYDKWKNREKGYSLDRIENDKWYKRGNLRFATKSVQARNTRLYKTNTSGFRGVSFVKREGKYSAHVKINNKYISLGHHDTAEQAAEAREIYLQSITPKQ